MFPRRNEWKETYPGSVLRNAVGLRTRSRVILSPVCLERRLYGILRGLKLYHSVLIASSLLLSPYKPLHFGIGISRLKNDPIRSQKANLYQDSWIVGATAGWVKLIRCCPEISWKSANSSLFLSVQQKLSWTASTCNKNTAGFLTWKLTVNLNNMSLFLKAGENSFLIQPSCFVYICLVYLGLRFGSWSRSQTIQWEWTNQWSTDVSFYFL